MLPSARVTTGLQHGELRIPQIRDQHQARRVGDRKGNFCRRDDRLRRDAAGPEYRDFISSDRDGIAIVGLVDVGNADRMRKAEMHRRAVQITSRFPSVHGAPVHLGHPHSIGIADIGKPDYGDAVPIAPDEIPVFWACGVTPQSVISAAKIPFAITHAPGLMLITDLQNRELAVL